MILISALVSGPEGGIWSPVVSEMRLTKVLFLESLGTMTLPDTLPRSTPAAVSSCKPAGALEPLWHPVQLELKIGWTCLPKSTCCAVAETAAVRRMRTGTNLSCMTLPLGRPTLSLLHYWRVQHFLSKRKGKATSSSKAYIHDTTRVQSGPSRLGGRVVCGADPQVRSRRPRRLV